MSKNTQVDKLNLLRLVEAVEDLRESVVVDIVLLLTGSLLLVGTENSGEGTRFLPDWGCVLVSGFQFWEKRNMETKMMKNQNSRSLNEGVDEWTKVMKKGEHLMEGEGLPSTHFPGPFLRHQIHSPRVLLHSDLHHYYHFCTSPSQSHHLHHYLVGKTDHHYLLIRPFDENSPKGSPSWGENKKERRIRESNGQKEIKG